MSKSRQAIRKRRRKREKRKAKAILAGAETYSGKKGISVPDVTDSQIANSITPYLLSTFKTEAEFHLGIREIGEATEAEDKEGLIVPRPIFILMAKPLLDTQEKCMQTVSTIFKKYSPFNLPVTITFTPDKFVKGGLDTKNKKDLYLTMHALLFRAITSDGYVEHLEATLCEMLKVRAEVENVSQSEYEDFWTEITKLYEFRSFATRVLKS